MNGFINILEQCVKNKVKKIVYASSSSVYGLNKKLPFSEEDKIESCNSPYACSKLSMEQIAKTYFQLYGMASIGLRFFTVYGPRGRPDMAIDKFLRGIHKQEKITKYGNGETSRDYTYVSDIIEGIYNSILRKEEDCQIYNLGNSNSITLNNFISESEKVVGKKAKIENLEYQMSTDDECTDKKSDRLKRTYMNASDSEKKLIDDVFITICGYSLNTLIIYKRK